MRPVASVSVDVASLLVWLGGREITVSSSIWASGKKVDDFNRSGVTVNERKNASFRVLGIDVRVCSAICSN